MIQSFLSDYSFYFILFYFILFCLIKLRRRYSLDLFDLNLNRLIYKLKKKIKKNKF